MINYSSVSSPPPGHTRRLCNLYAYILALRRDAVQASHTRLLARAGSKLIRFPARPRDEELSSLVLTSQAPALRPSGRVGAAAVISRESALRGRGWTTTTHTLVRGEQAATTHRGAVRPRRPSQPHQNCSADAARSLRRPRRPACPARCQSHLCNPRRPR